MNTFYHGDCLFVMRHDIEPETVDLIYLDPPFFTGKVQKGKAKSKWQPGAMEISYEDSKKFWGDTDKMKRMRASAPEWLKHIARNRPDFASYLFYMMERLQACEKVLKPTGSIYLHCDWRASYYLKMIMDEIFGMGNFRNEIAWCYTGPSAATKDFPRKHDTILRYTKSSDYTFNADAIRIAYSDSFMVRRQATEGNGGIFAGKQERELGEIQRYKKGKLPEDWWADIPSGGQVSRKERVGYPTQKPEALLERIIKTSSNEGDLVLDPFCGCGTTVIVASKLNRQFIGIDIDTSERKRGELPTAFVVIKNRSHELFAKAQYVSRDLGEVLAIENPKKKDGKDGFEEWVNGYYKATKPHPDKGIDGITQDGIPIQAKTYEIKYDKLGQFIEDARHHPKVPQPIKKVIMVSQVGFHESATKRQFEIQTKEGIEVILTKPEEMLKLGNNQGNGA